MRFTPIISMRLRKPAFWLGMICPILAVFLVLIWKPGDSTRQEPTQDTTQKRQISQSRASRETDSAVRETADGRKDLPSAPHASLPDDPATSQQEILEAMTLYSPEGLLPLVAYLRHRDPEIVSLAIEAIVQLGQPEGVEVLRSAAHRTPDRKLMQEMLDAADFLELAEYASEH